MTTTITAKGQVTIPKHARDSAKLKPGDRVEVRATASGGVYIEEPGRRNAYLAKLRKFAKQGIFDDGITTEEFVEFGRGESATYRPRKK
jgi:AbrB family looped-hinge helix DNA binding protein